MGLGGDNSPSKHTQSWPFPLSPSAFKRFAAQSKGWVFCTTPHTTPHTPARLFLFLGKAICSFLIENKIWQGRACFPHFPRSPRLSPPLSGKKKVLRGKRGNKNTGSMLSKTICISCTLVLRARAHPTYDEFLCLGYLPAAFSWGWQGSKVYILH